MHLVSVHRPAMEVPGPDEMDIYLTSHQLSNSQLDVYLGEMDIREICPTISLGDAAAKEGAAHQQDGKVWTKKEPGAGSPLEWLAEEGSPTGWATEGSPGQWGLDKAGWGGATPGDVNWGGKTEDGPGMNTWKKIVESEQFRKWKKPAPETTGYKKPAGDSSNSSNQSNGSGKSDLDWLADAPLPEKWRARLSSDETSRVREVLTVEGWRERLNSEGAAKLIRQSSEHGAPWSRTGSGKKKRYGRQLSEDATTTAPRVQPVNTAPLVKEWNIWRDFHFDESLSLSEGDISPTSGGLELFWNHPSPSKSPKSEGEPVRSKPKPEPLELPAEQNLTLTPPYTGTPRYLWTPTTSATSTVAFFSPEPRRIRIGNEFQATIPDLLQNNQSGATTVPLTRPVYTPPTDPVEEQRREHFFRETVPVYPDTEFLHHCVHKADGNLDVASRMARCPIQTKYPDDHPLNNYRYNGRWKWTLDDQDRFFLLFQQFGKNLLQIARWMPDKKVCDIVEYFYMWKIQNPELYKKWRNQVQPYRLIQPVIEYEQRAAPAKTSRARNRKEIVYYETEAYTTHDSRGNKEIKFRQKKVVNPYSSPARPARSNKPPNPQPLGSYKCKVCGKEFQKVKSRSAHMKTHKRQQNAVNSLISAPTLLQQTYHSQQLQQHLLQLKQLTPEMLPTTSVEQLLQMTSRDHMAIAAAAHQSREITMATTRESVMTSRQSVTSVISSQDRTDNSGAT